MTARSADLSRMGWWELLVPDQAIGVVLDAVGVEDVEGGAGRRWVVPLTPGVTDGSLWDLIEPTAPG